MICNLHTGYCTLTLDMHVSVYVNSYVDLTGYAAIMGTVFRDPKEEEPDTQTIALNKIVCGPSESHLVLLQLET